MDEAAAPVFDVAQGDSQAVPAECEDREQATTDKEQVKEWLHEVALKNASNLTSFFFFFSQNAFK